ncbi:hypothetical protein EVA_03396 [gut metagenome]|uniref:Uncharacterized protein n=1 Tax=gut metagenome TaxID=749906 RepID=J9GKY1_9ZZZZ
MVHPLLDSTLHFDLLKPVDIIGCSLIIRRARHEGIDFLLAIATIRIDAVDLHPCEELMMVNDIFFEGIPYLVSKVDMHLRIVRIHFTATFIDRQKDWFDTTRRLCHQTRGTRRRNRQTSNVTTTILAHFRIECRIGLLYAQHKRIVLLTASIVDFERSTLLCHLYRRSIGSESQSLLHLNSKFRCLGRTIAQPQSCDHIPLGGNAYTGTATLPRLEIDFLP